MDQTLTRLQCWVRSRALLYRLTWGTRVLLAVGFIPSGLVKLLGYRFTTMSPETDIGRFFETLYQSGPYWHFLGFAQVLAGILVLLPPTATLGALLFSGIMLNIFIITLSYDFNYTPVITGLMLLATLYLLLWDYDRLRGIFGLAGQRDMPPLPQHRLNGAFERGVYIVGTLAGVALLSGQRGLFPPGVWNLGFLLVCLLSFVAALGFGLGRPNVSGVSRGA